MKCNMKRSTSLLINKYISSHDFEFVIICLISILVFDNPYKIYEFIKLSNTLNL